MKRIQTLIPLSLALAVLLCSGPAAARGVSLKKVTMELVTSLVKGKGAAKHILSFKEISARTRKVKDKKAYDKAVAAWLKTMKLPKKYVVKDAKILDVVFIAGSKGGKIKKDVVMAMVKPVFTDEQATKRWLMPLFFIQTGTGWKLSIKK